MTKSIAKINNTYELRYVERNEGIAFMMLYAEVYPERDIPSERYWKWLFDTPIDYIPVGAWDKGKLIGFYSALVVDGTPICISAMVHPDYRGKHLISIIAIYCYTEVIKKGYSHVYLFANENIKDIYLNYLDFKMAFQIKEYRIPIDLVEIPDNCEWYSLPDSPDKFFKWRYYDHPIHKYGIYTNDKCDKYVVFRAHENRLQIIDFNDLTFALELGILFCKMTDNSILSFWYEGKLKHPFVLIPTWKMYKSLKKDFYFSLLNMIKNDRLRMGQSDVF